MKKTISLLILTAMLVSCLQTVLPTFAAGSQKVSDTKSEVLFETSFEKDDAGALQNSQPDGTFYSNLVYEKVESSSKGLSVDMSTVGGSADFKSSEGKLCLFDGRSDTKFLTENSTAEVYFKLEKSAVISSFMLCSANDAEQRDPKVIRLLGSNDGLSWSEIYRGSIEFSARHEEKTVSVSGNTAVYSWYKLAVDEKRGDGNMIQFAELALFGESVGSADDEQQMGSSPMATFAGNGPSSTWCNMSSVGWTGYRALTAQSKKTAQKAYARNVIYKDLDIKVSENTKLSYVIFPAVMSGDYDYYYTSMHFVIDLKFTDGSYLSSLSAYDHNGMEYTPEGQAHGEALFTMQWNYVEVDIASVALGKSIEQILVYFNMEDGEARTPFAAYFDDVCLENRTNPEYEHLSDYVDIRRGTNDTSSFSRGLSTPGVVTPNGANFYSPVTDPTHNQVCYKYQLAGKSNTLDSMSIMHVPSNWVASWGTYQFMANTSVNTASGLSSLRDSDIGSEKRKAEFSHDNEIARAHYYSVKFDEGSAASGVTMEITPTDHGMYARFTFPKNSDNVNIIFDCLWAGGAFTMAEDGSFIARSDHTSAGSSKMHIYGVFDTPVKQSKSFSGGGAIVSFPKGTEVVTMKLATSYISSSQAKHSLELEIGNSDFDATFAKAQKAWDDICGIIEIEGATYTEKVTFYSCMYRLYAYPTLYSENEGTNENPKWVYASPYNNGKKTSGKMYTTNGFWDTYRTTWAAYGLLTPELDGELLDGLVQHYKDNGWVPRWIAPAGYNSMVGTSSDVIFGDAYVKGLSFDFENAYYSMLKNASVVSKNLTNGGREQTETSVFKGYVSNSTNNGYSWTMEGFINDYGLYVMSEKLGKSDEAAYYLNRCLQYVNMFNKQADFFMGKNDSGAWSSGSNFNPAGWWGDYTEASGWIMAFTTVYDGNGLANLYGGKDKFADKLDAFFDDSVEAMKKVTNGSIHEEREAREVRMGQYAHNNQPSHHIAYMYGFTNEPYKTQALTREILKRLYVGAEIGQGNCGDEDNGEMSAWYIFSSIGLYPLSMGSGEYAVTSPAFDKVTVNLENGKKLVIKAENNSDSNVYIQSCKINGIESNALALSHETLLQGGEIVYKMGSEPSKWGTKDYTGAELTEMKSLTVGDSLASPMADIVSGRVKYGSSVKNINNNITVGSSIEGLSELFDNTSAKAVKVKNGESIVIASSVPRRVEIVTLTSFGSSKNVEGYTLEASNDGESWAVLDAREKLKFDWGQYTRPFALPEDKQGMYCYYRITFKGASSMNLAELELIGSAGEKGNVTPIDPTPDTKDPTPEAPERNPGDNSVFVIIALTALGITLVVGAVALVLVLRKKKGK